MLGSSSRRRERLRREASDWIARLEGEPAKEDLHRFQRWYGADPLNAETFDRIKAIYASAELLAQSQLGRNRALPDAPRSAPRSRYAMAAGLVIILLVSGAVFLGRPDALMPSAEAQTLLFATKVGEIRQVPLPDGTRMTLDAKSSVRIDIGEKVRHATLSAGRARFDVRATDHRPFLVEAGPATATAQAGIFDVALTAGEATVQAIEGVVAVDLKRQGTAAAPLRLVPGQVARIASNGRTVEAGGSSGSAALWPSGRLEFADTPLDKVLAEANRYSSGQISLGDPALGRLRVTGTFRAGDLEGLARSLREAFALRLERPGAGRFVLNPDSPERQLEDQKKNGG